MHSSQQHNRFDRFDLQMPKFTVEDIQKLYASEAVIHGVEGTSTIQDIRTRKLELDAIASYIRDGQKVLEVGCGNGYLAACLIRRFNIDLVGFDFSEDLITQAQVQQFSDIRGRAAFSVGDVLTIDFNQSFDLIFSMRCLQNLTSWEDQKKALANVTRALKIGAEYIMEEGFWTGLNNLNEARRELGLDAISEPWHNIFFHEQQTIEFLKSIGCLYVDQNAFLSGYYFGSRVLLPALMPKDKKVSSGSRLNDYFAHLPPAGDFCPMKILRFKRTG
jgi:ubiquinone/menaquinone biosynthesis C-methylase UbiE